MKNTGKYTGQIHLQGLRELFVHMSREQLIHKIYRVDQGPPTIMTNLEDIEVTKKQMYE